MGVKLQLVLGLILFNSVWIVSCTSAEINNSTPQEQKSDDKLTNAIHKQPKTETTEIKYVNNNTPINIKNVSDTKNESESIDEQYEKQNEVEKDTFTENSGNKKEVTPKRREDNGRSIDIEKYISPEFQNNEFTLSMSSDTEKYLEEPFSFKTSTKGVSEFDRTTPKTSMFTKFTEPVQKLEQEYEDHLKGTDQEFRDDHIDLENNHDDEDDHFEKEDDDHDSNEHEIDDITVDKMIERSESVPRNISVDWEMKISKDDPDKNKNKNLKSFTVVKYRKVDYVTHFNDTKVFDSEPKGDSEVLNTTTTKTPTSTTRKNNLLTKPPTDKNNSHLLSNKIETETIKAINLVTTEIPTTKKLKGDEGNKEQTAQDTQITRTVTTINDQNVSTEAVTNETTTNNNIERVTSAIDQTERISDNRTFASEETTVKTTEKMDNTSTTESSATTTEIVTEPETTTLEITSYPSTTQFTQEDIYVGTDVPTTTDFEITTLIESRFLKEENLKGNSTNSQVTDVSITTVPTIVPKIFPSTETQTSDRPTTIESVSSTTTSSIKSETTKLTITSDGPKELSTDAAETTENIAATGPAIEIMSDGTTTMPETTSENGNVIIKMTEAIKEMRKNDTTTTTEKMEPQTQSTTTEVSFVHVETTGTNQTTFIPETLSPNFNYPIANSENKERVSTNYNVRSGPGETTTTEDPEETTGTSSATENIVIDDDGNNKGKIAAIVISTVGAVCLVILAGLLYVVKKRQRKFNYKQRCRPVNLDDYSVDNLSVFNSVRRKDVDRQSKRSYGNPAFDDPSVTSHPLNFPALAKFATNVEDMKAEFEEIPQITARANELPEGCETKNRYANVIPLPETRVYLKTVEGVPNSDYINANYVTGPKNTRGYYIACQAPKQNTVDDFWRMIWEQQCKVILMITHLFENGVEKCVDYLPPSEVLDCHRLFGDFQVTLKKREAKEKYIISSIQLKNMVSNSWRDVTHFWYLGWPEKGVPSEANSLIAFLIEARSYMKAGTLEKNTSPNDMRDDPSQNELNPVVVHCSPGTGRTGVVIACDIAIREFEKIRLVDIPKIVYRIRRDRANAVQTKEQYMFIYKVISLYATKLTGGALDSF